MSNIVPGLHSFTPLGTSSFHHNPMACKHVLCGHIKMTDRKSWINDSELFLQLGIEI